MKKEHLSLISFLLICLLLSGCGATEAPPTDAQVEPTAPVESESGAPIAPVDPSDTAELLPPVMKWWELYNPNGFDTVTAAISNPNDVAIDVSYDLVYYKDGAEVSRSEYFSNFSILPGHDDIIWANADIPSHTDVDDVKMENVTVTESAYPPVDGSYEYRGIIDGEATYDFTFDAPIDIATIWFVLYNDSNANKRFDAGEIVVASSETLLEQEGSVSYDTDVYQYTNCDVFFNAS